MGTVCAVSKRRREVITTSFASQGCRRGIWIDYLRGGCGVANICKSSSTANPACTKFKPERGAVSRSMLITWRRGWRLRTDMQQLDLIFEGGQSARKSRIAGRSPATHSAVPDHPAVRSQYFAARPRKQRASARGLEARVYLHAESRPERVRLTSTASMSWLWMPWRLWDGLNAWHDKALFGTDRSRRSIRLRRRVHAGDLVAGCSRPSKAFHASAWCSIWTTRWGRVIGDDGLEANRARRGNARWGKFSRRCRPMLAELSQRGVILRGMFQERRSKRGRAVRGEASEMVLRRGGYFPCFRANWNRQGGSNIRAIAFEIGIGLMRKWSFWTTTRSREGASDQARDMPMVSGSRRCPMSRRCLSIAWQMPDISSESLALTGEDWQRKRRSIGTIRRAKSSGTVTDMKSYLAWPGDEADLAQARQGGDFRASCS